MHIINNPKNGDRIDATTTMYPSYLEVVSGRLELLDEGATRYGYVLCGSANLKGDPLEVVAKAGTFFCWPGNLCLVADGLVVVICRYGFRGLLSVGLIEQAGRLTYIDGCSSTILAQPPRVGDPVLNHLHFPPETLQTEHTHPTIRFGVVARGQGIAFGSHPCGDGKWEKSLSRGSVFLLHAQERHAFHTLRSSDGMDVISYHPESDWGPTDQNHPMLTRTYMSGHH